MRVLVTGGAGYIGSHAARALARRGHKVLIYDNLSTGHRILADGFDLVVGDIGDAKTVAAALRDIDAVLHFAAHAYVGESVQNPRKYFENNVQSALAFLNAVVDAGVRHFVFSSTCAVYGVPTKIPITEGTVRQPVNPYGASKLFFENALEAYSNAYGLRYVTLRYFNAAGADDSGEIGEMHEPETHLIPCALQVAARIRPNLEVYGTDYPTPDGTCMRDYVHISDLAEAHVLALEYLASGGQSAALNLGTGKGHSVKEVISAVEEVTGVMLPKQMCPRRPGDPPVLVADASRARQMLKWSPSRSLQDIVASAWQWAQKSDKRRRFIKR
jgi:UDP-glucose-4-epimerase GalE